jgi:hypothetical protein
MRGASSVTTEDELDRQVRSASRRFYEELEMRCKRYQPNHFAPAVVDIMRRCHKAAQWASAPPHQVGLAIEANCAYTRRSNNDKLTWNGYAHIMNVFRANEDPALVTLLKRDFGNCFLVLHRQQIELQRSIAKQDIARFYRLFIAESPLRELGAEMKERDGITPEAWLKSCLAVYCALFGNQGNCVKISPGCSFRGLDLDAEDVQVFLRHASHTPQQIGERFKQLRNNIRPVYHSCIRSVFAERPLINFGDGRYQAPFPAMLFHFGAEGLYRRLLNLPSFSDEFGTAIRKYVDRIAGCFPDVQLQLRDKQLKKASRTKSCDVLLELPSHIILIESKTTEFTRDIIIPSTIANDNSTRKVSDAIEQIYCTARDVRDGLFQRLGVSTGKPIWAVVSTFGDIPFANAPWYFDRYLGPAAKASEEDRSLVSGRPVVISLRYLELLAAVMTLTRSSLPDLFNRREQLGYGATGDWDAFLGGLVRDAKQQYLLPHVQSDFEAFFETLGVPRNVLRDGGTSGAAEA